MPFELASILISLAIIPVCLTRAAAPALAQAASLPLRRLFAASPLGVVGARITGLLLGAFYGLAAIYARRPGLSLARTATSMKVVHLRGVGLNWPLGRMSDRQERCRGILRTEGRSVERMGGMKWWTCWLINTRKKKKQT